MDMDTDMDTDMDMDMDMDTDTDMDTDMDMDMDTNMNMNVAWRNMNVIRYRRVTVARQVARRAHGGDRRGHAHRGRRMPFTAGTI